jgi:hypothetical protein
MSSSSGSGGGLGVAVVIGALILFLPHGCSGGSSSSSTVQPAQYSATTKVVKDFQGHDVYTSTDNQGRTFTCTFKANGDSDCSGTP